MRISTGESGKENRGNRYPLKILYVLDLWKVILNPTPHLLWRLITAWASFIRRNSAATLKGLGNQTL